MKLTQAAIPKIKRDAAGKSEHIEWDDALPGFGLRVRDGRCTWIVQYKIGAKHRRVTLGTVEMLTAEQARLGWKTQENEKRDGAAKILTSARDGHDHATKRAVRRKQASHTLEAEIARYLEAKKPALRPRSYEETKRHLEMHWKPLHGLPLANISKANVAAETAAIAKRSGPIAANRARASLSALFRWEIGAGFEGSNPVAGTNKQDEGDPRKRTLTDAEAAAIWQAAPENNYGRIVRLLMLTACRRDEIGSLQWSEVDLEAGTITLPPARTKNNNEHIVPLSKPALAILKEIPQRAERDSVFGSGRGGYASWSKAKKKLDGELKIKDWTLHDIRRTVRTGLGGLGVTPWVAEAVLNHLPPRLIRTYAVSGQENETNLDRRLEVEKRAALDSWANHLAVATAQANGANVTTLRKAQGRSPAPSDGGL
jgi:integrase